jgi:hypothetical protein
MAENLANSNGLLGQQVQQNNPMMAMNQNGFGGYNPFMMNPMMLNAGQNANLSANLSVPSNLSANLSVPSNLSAQTAFQNAFF